MKNILLLACLCLSLNSFGQNRKFSFGVELSPKYCNSILTNDGSVPEEVFQTFKGLESPAIGHGAMLFARYRLNHQLAMQLGLGYNNAGSAYKKTKLTFEVPEPSAPEYTQFSWRYLDIAIPLSLRYNLSRKTNSFYVTGGLTPLILLKRLNKKRLWYSNGLKTVETSDDESTGYLPVNINGAIGFGYEGRLSKKLRWYVQPTAECNILGQSKDAALNRKIYSFGLAFGLLMVE